ncbi:MAG: hypothetical protein AAF267_17835 [Deinococcota bacterium]
MPRKTTPKQLAEKRLERYTKLSAERPWLKEPVTWHNRLEILLDIINPKVAARVRQDFVPVLQWLATYRPEKEAKGHAIIVLALHLVSVKRLQLEDAIKTTCSIMTDKAGRKPLKNDAFWNFVRLAKAEMLAEAMEVPEVTVTAEPKRVVAEQGVLEVAA